MNLHRAVVYDSDVFGLAWFVSACSSCDWWGAFLDHEDARRHAARHVALTATSCEQR